MSTPTTDIPHPNPPAIPAARTWCSPWHWWPDGKLTLLITTLLLLSFNLQYPTSKVADWLQFSFYDPGTILKGDLLLQQNYIPTIDFGYTHGLLSLLYASAGFGILGRSPQSFLLLSLLTQIAMAWSLARILRATGLCKNPWSFAFILIALPMAIMPAYLTLTHPLEAMLILMALASQSEGKKSQALVIMTVCIFVKPSMAYVYGFALVLLILWENRGSFVRIAWDLLPALIALALVVLLLHHRFGIKPVLNTMLPLTGAKTYASTNFGFFNESGLAFWLHPPLPDFNAPHIIKLLAAYLLAPPAIFLLAALATLLGGLAAAYKLLFPPTLSASVPQCLSASPSPPPSTPQFRIQNSEFRIKYELLATIAFLHTAFLLGFYGWTGSWTYYSYLPVLGLALTAQLLTTPVVSKSLSASVPPFRKLVFPLLTLLMFLSHGELLVVSLYGWLYKTPHADPAPGAMPGLWRDDRYADWQQAVAAVGTEKTLIMTNGFFSDLPPTMQMPDAWFPEPGIPTASEIERVKQQVTQANRIILWWEYRKFDLWNSPEFEDERAQFEPLMKTGKEMFIVLKRKVSASAAAPATR